MRALATALLLLALPRVSGGGEVPVPEVPGTGCDRCLGKAWMPCDHALRNLKRGDAVHAPKELDVGSLKTGSFLCSECLKLACCQGLGWIPCPSCAPEPVRSHREGLLKERRAFAEGRRKLLDARLGAAPIHIRTDHFELVIALKFQRAEIDIDARTGEYRDDVLDDEKTRAKLIRALLKDPPPHLLAHLYARRLEECYERFSRTFDPDGSRPVYSRLSRSSTIGFTPLQGERSPADPTKTVLPEGLPVRQWVFLLPPLKQGSLEGLSGNGRPGKNRQPSAGSFFFDVLGTEGSKNFQTDGGYHHYLYHNVAELLVHDYVLPGPEYEQARSAHKNPGEWRNPSLDLPDWLHEGWARVQEMDRFGEAQVQCRAEVMSQDFRSGKRSYYLKELQREMGKGRLLPFSEISRSHLDQFNALVHMQIWSITDFLRRRDPAAFPRLIARIKCLSAELGDGKEGFARALEEVLSLTPLGLEEAWKADLAKQRP